MKMLMQRQINKFMEPAKHTFGDADKATSSFYIDRFDIPLLMNEICFEEKAAVFQFEKGNIAIAKLTITIYALEKAHSIFHNSN